MDSRRRRAILTVLLAAGSLVATALLWQEPILLTGALLLIGAGLLAANWSKSMLAVYLMGCVFGPLAEGVAIHAGAWTYTRPLFWGMPAWLPLLWGAASVYLVWWHNHVATR